MKERNVTFTLNGAIVGYARMDIPDFIAWLPNPREHDRIAFANDPHPRAEGSQGRASDAEMAAFMARRKVLA